MKYLLKDYGYEHTKYSGFESNLSKDGLTEQLKTVINGLDKYDYGRFMGIEVINAPIISQYKIMTLDEFWAEVLVAPAV